jgi:hypothetical protein
MRRFLKYHAGPKGLGYEKISLTLPLATGIYTHSILAEVLVAARDGVLRDELTRKIITKNLSSYREDVKGRGFDEVESSDTAFIVNEQCHLIETLCWGWILIELPRLLEEFEILDVEREELAILGETEEIIVKQMSRPDFTARRRQDRQVGYHELKTSAFLNEDYVDSFRTSVQMAAGTLGVEARLGEPVTHYYVHVLNKGGRRKFEGRGLVTPTKRQYSHLCYARVVPARPPLNDVSWDLRGYWIDKTPVWEMEFPAKPPEMSKAEYWVRNLAPEELKKSFSRIGPYDRQDTQIEMYKIGAVGEEQRWFFNLQFLKKIKDPWESREYQETIAALFPRSWECQDCEFVPLCFRHPGWSDPVGLGRYKIREPHHLPERETTGDV